MNSLKKIFLVVCLSMFAIFSQAQKVKPVTTTFWVGGVCDMCKSRIEHTLDTKGVKNASYNLSNHQLTVTYVPSKISEQKLHGLLHQAGHDTSAGNATDEQYSKVHDCCRYREHENHTDEHH